MRALVTGGAGLIGSHLAEALLAAGDEVTIIDDLSTGRLENLEQARRHPGFRAVIDSCANVALMTELVAACDVTFHLAAAVGVKLVVNSPIRAIETNVRLTEVVLALCSEHRKPVLVASTSEVYGKNERVPFREDADLMLGPTDQGRWSYACSKALGEFLALAYWKERGLPAVVVRLFNTAGPRQIDDHGMVVPTFVRQALAGEDLTIYGDGSQSRCFTHVRDVVRALIDLMRSGRHFGQVFNVGNPHAITIVELAQRVRELTRSLSPLVFVPYEEAYGQGFEDTRCRVPEISKIERAIDWRPTLGLDQILADVIAHESGRAVR